MASSSKHKESPAEPFKRVLGLAVRAIAGDGEMQVSYAPGKPELDGKSVQLPEPSRLPSPNCRCPKDVRASGPHPQRGDRTRSQTGDMGDTAARPQGREEPPRNVRPLHLRNCDTLAVLFTGV